MTRYETRIILQQARPEIRAPDAVSSWWVSLATWIDKNLDKATSTRDRVVQEPGSLNMYMNEHDKGGKTRAAAVVRARNAVYTAYLGMQEVSTV